MNELFDAKESLSPVEREKSLFQRLPPLIENAKAHSEHYGKLFADLDSSVASSREGLSQLPITRKFDLPNQQQLKTAIWWFKQRCYRSNGARVSISRASV